MRRLALFVIALIVTAGFAAGGHALATTAVGGHDVSPTASESPAQMTTRYVEIDVRCPGPQSDIYVSVDPWVRVVGQGDATEWQITSRSNADSIMVTPKNPGSWPYDDPPPYGGVGAKSARAQSMKSNRPKGQEYDYNIEVTCNETTVLIDPKMRIGGD